MEDAYQNNFFQLSLDLLCVADREGFFKLVNPAFERTLGYTAAELSTQRFVDLVHPDDHAATVDALAQLQKNTASACFEARYRCQDGSYRWLAWKCPATPTSANVWYAAGRDITDQKMMVGEVSEHKSRLDAVMRTVVDGIITIDDRGIVQSINPAVERIFGYPSSEILGDNVSKLMPRPFREEHDSYIQSYVRTQQPKVIGLGREVVGRRKDGTLFPIDLTLSDTPFGGRRLFTGIVRDITERKRAELEQSSLGRIVEESLNELYFFDAETWRFVQVNRGARENIGFNMDELRELTPIDIQPEFTNEQFEQVIAPLKNGEQEKIIFETLYQRKDGSTYDVEVHLQMANYRERRVFVAIVLDVTSRKDADRQLNRLNEELERRVAERTAELESTQAILLQREKLATLGRISGGIAHEIRNPLNAIKTSVYYLLHAKNPKQAKMQEHLERIDRQVTLANNVVTTLSDFAKLPPPNVEAFDVKPCLEEVVETSSIPHGIAVEIVIPDTTPRVLADQSQILIVFRNLVRNARDAMPSGGTIKVTARVPAGDKVQIDVIDHGVGIPTDKLGKIMEPLYSTKPRGMGLGLAITKWIVEKNSGRLTVASMEGQGSTFTVELPSLADSRVEGI